MFFTDRPIPRKNCITKSTRNLVTGFEFIINGKGERFSQKVSQLDYASPIESGNIPFASIANM